MKIERSPLCVKGRHPVALDSTSLAALHAIRARYAMGHLSFLEAADQTRVTLALPADMPPTTIATLLALATCLPSGRA